mgnify:CR=1 FL=1|tara:strand:+ start:241 stop:738 length:498 start_codon:yes stop_codon:yes gene_type:complete
MLPAERDPTRIEDWERRIRYITLPLLWLSFFLTGALGAYVGIQQHECTEGLRDFDLLYSLSLSIIPGCIVILFYALNLYGFLLVLDDWYRISSTIFHILLYTYYGTLVTMQSIILNHHLEVDYNDSDCLDKFDQKHQRNSMWAAVVLCIFAMSLIQLTPFKEHNK